MARPVHDSLKRPGSGCQFPTWSQPAQRRWMFDPWHDLDVKDLHQHPSHIALHLLIEDFAKEIGLPTNTPRGDSRCELIGRANPAGPGKRTGGVPRWIIMSGYIARSVR